MTKAELYALADAVERAQRDTIGETRACPECGRPQHYTGTEHGWAHDALIDTWECADPAKPETRCTGCGMATELTCPSCGRIFCTTCLVVHRRGMPGRH